MSKCDVMRYEDVEKKFRISGFSPESFYAECAWNEALMTVLKLIESTKGLDDQLLVLIQEIEFLDTGERCDNGKS